MNKKELRCQCGARLAFSTTVNTNRFRCPTCEREILIEPSGKTHFSGPNKIVGGQLKSLHAARSETKPNGMAIVGFTLSMLSFFAIPLAPIAMLCSFVGLRGQRHFGLAVVGSVISSFLSMTLVVGLVFVLALGGFAVFIGNEVSEIASEMAEDARQRELRESAVVKLELAASKIDEHTIATQSLPSADEAETLLSYERDPWGYELVYRETDTELSSYLLRSIGPDGIEDTADDVGATFPSCAPTKSAEATLLLRAPHDRQRLVGCQWLSENAPKSLEVSREEQSRIVLELINLLVDERYAQPAKAALIAWTSDQPTEFLVTLTNRPDVDDQVRFEIFKEFNSPDGFLETLNSDIEAVRNQSRQELARLEVADARLIEQSLADLDESRKFIHAAERLQELPLPETRRELVGRKIISELRSKDVGEEVARTTLEAAIKMLDANDDSSLAKRKAIEELSSVLDNEFSSPAIDHMFLVDEQEAIKALALRLGARGVRGRAITRVLIESGPRVESAVIEQLSSTDSLTQEHAIQVLAEIGGTKSLAALEKLDTEAANEAIERIEERIEEQAEEMSERFN